MKIIKWSAAIILALFIAFLIFLYAITPVLNGNEKRTKAFFEECGASYNQFHFKWKDREVNVIESGDRNSNKMILFIHGAPGSYKDFSEYLVDPELMSQARLIAYDRPGYGDSDYGNDLPLIKEQVNVALSLIEKSDVDSIIVVGYSYGGPISGILVASGYEKITGLVMLAPANSPEAEPIFWFNKLINNKLFALILPSYIIMANKEKFSHLKDLDTVEPQWVNIRVPVHHFHCKNDWIAPFEGNVEFVKSRIREDLLTQHTWDGDSHFLPNSQLTRIKPILLDLLK